MRRLRDRDGVLPWLIKHGIDSDYAFAIAVNNCQDGYALIDLLRMSGPRKTDWSST